MLRPERQSILRKRVASYLQPSPTPIKAGDAIVWKEGLKNRRLPEYGAPIIVVEVIDPPILDDEKSTASTYFREPLTIRAAALDEDDEMMMWHFDGSRFELYDPSQGDTPRPDVE